MLCYCKGTARRAMLVNFFYILLCMGVKNVSNGKNDIQSYSRCYLMGHIRFHISVPLQLCLYIATLTRYYQLFP